MPQNLEKEENNTPFTTQRARSKAPRKISQGMRFIVYLVVVIIVTFRNAAHFYKWYVKDHPINLQCSKCQATVPLKRCLEHEV